MKANGLQIGDIVCFATRPFIIDGISVGGGSVHSDKEGWQPTSEITPYPLTPEILEKNGWKQRWGWWGNGNCPFWLVKYTEGSWAEGKWGVRFNEDSNDDAFLIYGLNELQHTLRLCGIDKEIAL